MSLCTFFIFPSSSINFHGKFSSDSANGYYLDQRFQLDVDDDDLEEAELLSGKWAVLIRSSSCDSGALAGVLANVRSFSIFYFI